MLLLSYVIAINYPSAKFYFSNSNETYDTLVWEDVSILKPTREQLQSLYDKELSAYALREIQSKRYQEYPALAEQLDMLYHDKINNTDTWLEAIQAVKNKYPKS